MDEFIDVPISVNTASGFPSPAADYVERKLDLNEYLISNRQATFFFRVSGNSMIGAGIHNGDLLIVDRSLNATHNKIVVATVQGEILVKRLLLNNKKIRLMAENPSCAPIEVTSELEFSIWGVVTNVIHAV